MIPFLFCGNTKHHRAHEHRTEDEWPPSLAWCPGVSWWARLRNKEAGE